ncbi:hypothetical protein ACJMK2_003189 [Sinanodonta woodiana]|uniref:Galactosylgalactosylxylosylprotein 3-beta-glucuronosyltransferase n=1 Tax=Sinanodonta woodiana TaxID=1069815 RepID=A0ABD3TKL9_SINWO
MRLFRITFTNQKSFLSFFLDVKLKTMIQVGPAPECRCDSYTSATYRANHNPYDIALKRNAAPQPDTPTIFVVTPTYTRNSQKSELTMLSNTLRNVYFLTWIVVEDSQSKSDLVTRFLKHCGVPYVHLNGIDPLRYTKTKAGYQRNLGIQWIRDNVNPIKTPGVVYFADDDNSYDVRIFDEMRNTKNVSVWPVGFRGAKYQAPMVENGKVVGFMSFYGSSRKFAIDMAGFAVNIRLLFERPKARFYYQQQGILETSFLTCLKISYDDLEPKASNCTEVLVWHTRTKEPSFAFEAKMVQKYGKWYNPDMEV